LAAHGVRLAAAGSVRVTAIRRSTWGTVRLFDVIRLGFATLASAKVEEQAAYYTGVLGLKLVAADPALTVFANQAGQHVVVLERGDAAGIRGLAFEIAPDSDLGALAVQLRASGVSCDIQSDPVAGVATCLAVADPDGTLIQLVPKFDSFDVGPLTRGIAPAKLGHVARFTSQLRAQLAFYKDVLGFRISDWRADESAYFMRCGPDHHTVNFFAAPSSKLHHIAFELRDWSEIGRACNILAENRLRLDWGPSRHVIGHNIACYHSTSEGVRIELYTEMDQMTNERLGYFDPRPWHEDRPQFPRGWGPEFGKSAWGP
ncbi:MAG TPA: VOC family protein, partial [Devosia sp.]|nr:VOC family protein [Devosia sp.]